jgi:uncharacterized protein (DUF2461 family)
MNNLLKYKLYLINNKLCPFPEFEICEEKLGNLQTIIEDCNVFISINLRYHYNKFRNIFKIYCDCRFSTIAKEKMEFNKLYKLNVFIASYMEIRYNLKGVKIEIIKK